ncbi:CRISPR-associated protein Cas7 [Salinibacter ruber]|uniref:CRISPR-associated protein Cas7 n=1 Tax=Salinibacter ruber TaxID=146919 RepID=UPI000E5690F6|nr:CRISPR-associated protein Cas7 [Salinibacter ruber]MCS3638963.1 hypothetical protein [Salinibacter ruber]
MSANCFFVRGLRQVSHTVFSVQDGQKTYYDPQFEETVAYSSGQQVKRSILDAVSDALNERRAPVTFNKTLSANGNLEDGEPWSPCDPRYADQLLGGWMRAESGGGNTVKRRSPLSISAMRPLHPLLAGLARESASYDRSDDPEQHSVRVVNSDGEEMSDEEVQEFLESNDRMLPRRKWIPQDQVGPRAHGLYVFDVAVDLDRLFTVSTNQHEPELDSEKINELQEEGWTLTENEEHLVCPEGRRDEIIEALATGLTDWRVTSNQSRTFSPQPTLCLAVSDDANRVTNAIRADLTQEGRGEEAVPVIETFDGVSLYTMPACKGHVTGVTASPDALDKAREDIVDRLQAAEAPA